MAVINLPGTSNGNVDANVGTITNLPTGPSSVTVGTETGLDVVLQPGASIAGKTRLRELNDVDLTVGLENNSLLIYHADDDKWRPTKKLEDHYMNAGHF